MMEIFFPFAPIFFYFFRFFFYLLPPTHSQPHRKTTGELTFRVKRGLIMLLLLQRNLQMRTGGKSQVTKPSHRHPLHSLLPPHPHQSWLQPQRSYRPEAIDCLVTIHGHITVNCICVGRSVSLAVVEVWKFRVNFFNVILFETNL